MNALDVLRIAALLSAVGMFWGVAGYHKALAEEAETRRLLMEAVMAPCPQASPSGRTPTSYEREL